MGVVLNERQSVDHIHKQEVEPLQSGDVPLLVLVLDHLLGTEQELVHELSCINVWIHLDVCLQVVYLYVV